MEEALAQTVATEISQGIYFECTAYINENFGFFVRFPISWEYKENVNDNLVYAYNKNNTNESFASCAISVYQATMNSNIDSSALAQIPFLKSTYTIVQEPVITKISIGGADSRKISFSARVSDQDTNGNIYLCLKNGYYYCVSFSTSVRQEKSFSSDIDKIIGSFAVVQR